MRYMLDTNICIYLMRNHPPEVAERFATLRYGGYTVLEPRRVRIAHHNRRGMCAMRTLHGCR